MAAENGGHRYETKLRHCHAMYTPATKRNVGGEMPTSQLTQQKSRAYSRKAQ